MKHLRYDSRRDDLSPSDTSFVKCSCKASPFVITLLSQWHWVTPSFLVPISPQEITMLQKYCWIHKKFMKCLSIGTDFFKHFLCFLRYLIILLIERLLHFRNTYSDWKAIVIRRIGIYSNDRMWEREWDLSIGRQFIFTREYHETLLEDLKFPIKLNRIRWKLLHLNSIDEHCNAYWFAVCKAPLTLVLYFHPIAVTDTLLSPV